MSGRECPNKAHHDETLKAIGRCSYCGFSQEMVDFFNSLSGSFIKNSITIHSLNNGDHYYSCSCGEKGAKRWRSWQAAGNEAQSHSCNTMPRLKPV